MCSYLTLAYIDQPHSETLVREKFSKVCLFWLQFLAYQLSKTKEAPRAGILFCFSCMLYNIFCLAFWKTVCILCKLFSLPIGSLSSLQSSWDIFHQSLANSILMSSTYVYNSWGNILAFITVLCAKLHCLDHSWPKYVEFMVSSMWSSMLQVSSKTTDVKWVRLSDCTIRGIPNRHTYRLWNTCAAASAL